MSRLEKIEERNLKRRKRAYKIRIIFILVMIINTMICVIIVNKSANDMLGKNKYNTQEVFRGINTSAQKSFDSIKNGASTIFSKGKMKDLQNNVKKIKDDFTDSMKKNY